MAWFYEMAQFVNYHMLDTPLWQQQYEGRDADAVIADVTLTPARDGGLEIDDTRFNTHLFGILFHHWLHQRLQSLQCFVSLFSSG